MADTEARDLLGLAPYGVAVNTLTKGVVDGAGAFLSRICLPAAEEFGLLLRDKVSAWRARNAVRIALKAESILAKNKGPKPVYGHPRLVMATLAEGSWTDDDLIQSMWAGLLATSCSPDGNDESNLIFTQLLSQLTSTQVRFMNYICEHCEKKTTKSRLLYSDDLTLTLNELVLIYGVTDIQRIDRELDHLRGLGLLSFTSGLTLADLPPENQIATVGPATIALQLYARSQGYLGDPVEFFTITPSNGA